MQVLVEAVKVVLIMQTLINPHWAPCHVGPEDDRFMMDLRPKVIKLFFAGDSIPRLDVALSAATDLVILRQHGISENYDQRGISNMTHAEKMARDHAEAWKKLLAPTPSKNKIAVEGLNEIEVWDWGKEKPELASHYYAELAKLMSVQGVRTVVGNIGVGWPGNGEPSMPPNSPPIWKPFAEMIETAIKLNGFLGLHEYTYINGAKDPWIENGQKYGGWGWWAGRFRTCPWKVPIIITEYGIDAHVLQGKDYYGWHGLNEPRDSTYMWQLIEYEYQCILDGRVVALTPFTEDFYDPKWATYSTRTEQFHKLWLEHARKMERGEYVLPEMWALPKWSSIPWKPTVSPMPVPPVPVPTPIPTPTPSGNQQIMRWEVLVKKYCGSIDPNILLTLIKIESGGNPNAYNEVSKATGLGQIMPMEAGESFKDRPTSAELLVPDTNIQWMVKILSDDLGYYKNKKRQLERAVSAYFGGRKLGDNLVSMDSVLYIKAFCKRWGSLFTSFCPVSMPDNSLPEYRDLLGKAVWYVEEATRKIESIQAGGDALVLVREARSLLVNDATTRLILLRDL